MCIISYFLTNFYNYVIIKSGDFMKKYYDGTKLLSLLDINGNKPEIYICTSNRTAGKTTYFSRLCVNRFLDKSQKFLVLYRYQYELSNCHDKFFKDLKSLFFTEHEMTSKIWAKGVYYSLILDGYECGYAVSINSADSLKKYSHIFNDVHRIIFDEFQSENNKYAVNELQKFISIHTSVARGNGEMVRYVPVYMISNPVTLLNPYYVELGISEKLNSTTKFLKGDGFVLEQGFNEEASEEQRKSAFNRAFSNNNYIAYSSQGIYLNDSKTFIEKPYGISRYECTLKFEGVNYGIRSFDNAGILYCDNTPDMSNPNKISVTTDDHEINYVMLRKNDNIINNLRYYFERGCFRFKDIKCKAAVLKALSYT